MRRCTIVLSIIACLLLTSGCWDRREVKDLAIVTASGLDYNPDGTLTQSVQIAVPAPSPSSGNSGDPKSFFVLAAKGKTLAETRQRLQQKIHLKLYYSHRRVIVIGEGMARHGLEQVFDSFHREMDMRMRNMVFVAYGTDAATLLQYPAALESIPADQFQNLHKQPSGKATTIMNFDAMASSDGIEPIMGAFEVIPKQAPGPSSSKSASGPRIKLHGVGIFKKLKLIGYFNDEETLAMNWVTKSMADSMLTTYVPQGRGNISVHITASKHRLRPEIKGKTIRMNVSVKGECELVENGTKLDFTQPENVKLANKLLSSEMVRNIQKTVKKSQQQYNADVFGFGRNIYVTNPKAWKRLAPSWPDLYPKVEVAVDATMSIKDTGFAKMPLYRNEKTGDVE